MRTNENNDTGNQRNPDGTWRQSCLEHEVEDVPESSQEAVVFSQASGTPLKPVRKSVQFSPYNKVQLMSPRRGGFLRFIEEEEEQEIGSPSQYEDEEESDPFDEISDDESIYLSPGPAVSS